MNIKNVIKESKLYRKLNARLDDPKSMDKLADELNHDITKEILPHTTRCACCGDIKETPLRRDDMGGYVCLMCVDKELTELQNILRRINEICKNSK